MSTLREQSKKGKGVLQESSPNVTGTKRSSRPAKRSRTDFEHDEYVDEYVEEDGEEHVGEPLTPMTTRKAKKGQAKSRKAQDEDEQEDVEELPTPKTSKKSKKPKKGKGKGRKTTAAEAVLSEVEDELIDDEEQAVKDALAAEMKTRVEKLMQATGLRKIGPGDQIKALDRFDPRSFQQIDGGSAYATFRGAPWEFEHCFDRASQNCRNILAARRESLDQGADPSVFSAGQAATLLERDSLEIWRDLKQYIIPDTLASLGRKKFETKHLEEMRGFTSTDLKSWIIYYGWIEYENGHVECYGGRSLATEGSGPRLVNAYELAMRHKVQGTFLGSSHKGFGRALLDKNVKRAFLRPFAVFPIPEDDAEKNKLEKLASIGEGLATDFAQCVDNGSAVTEMVDREIDNRVMLEHVKAAAPKNREVPWRGLNRISPFVQGYGSGAAPGWNAKGIKRRAEVTAQGIDCPSCGADMTVRTSDTMPSSAISPLWGKVDWLTHKLCCGVCYAWLRMDDGARLDWVVENIHSEAELKAHRLSRKDTTGPNAIKLAPTTQTSGQSCPLCQLEYEERKIGVNAARKKGMCFATKNIHKDIPSLKSIDWICYEDKLRLTKMKEGGSKNVGPMKELKTDECDFDRFLEIFGEYKARAPATSFTRARGE